jgi:hypothetical protein
MQNLDAMPITPTCTSPKIAGAILGEAGGDENSKIDVKMIYSEQTFDRLRV